MRLSLLPTNFTTHIWNRTNDPRCPLCFGDTESIAHLFNGCREFHNFCSRRHDRIVGKLFDEIKLILCSRKKLYTNKLLETLLPEYREELTLLQQQKPDIVIIDEISRDIIIAEVTVCFDLYFEYSFQRSVIATRICVTFFVKKDGTLLFMYCVLVRLAVSKGRL